MISKLRITDLRLTEDNPSILSDTSVPVGFGIGLIVAATAATASNASSVAMLGLEGVEIAFRLAIELQRVSREIKESDGIWARIVFPYKAEEVQQHSEKANGTLRPLHHAYISQLLPGSPLVFGPPSNLDILAKTSNFSQGIISNPTPSKYLLCDSHLPPVKTAKVL